MSVLAWQTKQERRKERTAARSWSSTQKTGLSSCSVSEHGCLCRLTTLLSFERSLDTVVWQMLASVACPGSQCRCAALSASTLLLLLLLTSCAVQATPSTLSCR